MTDTTTTHEDDDQGRILGSDPEQWSSDPGRRLARTHRRLAERIGLGGASALGLVIGGATVLASTALAITVYDGVTGRSGITRVDRPALRLGKRLRSRPTDLAAGGIALLFGPVGMPIMTLGAATALTAKRRTPESFAVISAAGLGSLAMTLLGKRLVHRNRPPRRDAAPPYEHSPSFPSGHTINATSIVGILAYLFMLHSPRRGREPLIAAAAGTTVLTVGASRVLLGAHWFTDVVMGWTTGAGWLASIITVHRLHATNSSRSAAEGAGPGLLPLRHHHAVLVRPHHGLQPRPHPELGHHPRQV